jgi:hypothetical protein
VRKDDADSFEYKEWQRGCIHDILHSILLPLQNVMDDGINLMCPDGQRRLCFPVIQQYIADYEEQRMLASILSGYCPKCTIPSNRKGKLRTEVDGQPLPQHQPAATYSSGMIIYPPRDGDDAKQLRNRYRRMDKFRPNQDLEAFGYHETVPFTQHYPFSDIYEALAPDLLHQILKLSYDRLASEWIQKVIEATENLSDKKAHGEIDARYTQIPPYPGLRHFTKGIFKTKRWTGNEHWAMMAVYAGVIKGIVPEACEALVKVWLDIIRMSHYKSHTDSTLKLLATAINSFWVQLWDPKGPFVKDGGVVPGWHTPKLHYFQHYSDYIRANGSLSFCSTNRTEAWHKQIKEAYRRSNKGPQALEFVLRDEARRFACVSGKMIYIGDCQDYTWNMMIQWIRWYGKWKNYIWRMMIMKIMVLWMIQWRMMIWMMVVVLCLNNLVGHCRRGRSGVASGRLRGFKRNLERAMRDW